MTSLIASGWRERKAEKLMDKIQKMKSIVTILMPRDNSALNKKMEEGGSN